jgi:hypothetical protein
MNYFSIFPVIFSKICAAAPQGLMGFMRSLAHIMPANAQTYYSLPTIGNVQATSPDTLVKLVFDYSTAVAGLCAFIAFIIGGAVYLFSAGNPSKVEDAKDRLLHALLGFLLVAFAGITLRFINPDLFKFNKLVLPGITIKTANPAGAPEEVSGYLSCRNTTGGVAKCMSITDGSACADDPQCAPCIGLSAGQSCSQTPQNNSGLVYFSCVRKIPCNTSQGGTCPANFPCSEITGGQKSAWEIVDDALCSEPVDCIDGSLFAAGADVCCMLNN